MKGKTIVALWVSSNIKGKCFSQQSWMPKDKTYEKYLFNMKYCSLTNHGYQRALACINDYYVY